ncbi:maltose phosphorylase [Salmonella bongori]|nr:maltose phosphorylase [Salmonella bongori]
MQILKQADVVMLAYMQPTLFTPHTWLANLRFYEPRTIHDSSLSKAIHGIVATRCGDPFMGYQFWRDGARIDLGDDPHSCDEGIHAAATGLFGWGQSRGLLACVFVVVNSIWSPRCLKRGLNCHFRYSGKALTSLSR